MRDLVSAMRARIFVESISTPTCTPGVCVAIDRLNHLFKAKYRLIRVGTFDLYPFARRTRIEFFER